MRPTACLSGLASLVARVAALDYPATVEIDIVYPLNKTYNNVTQMPVVFAIQNAEAAFAWGYDISWQVDEVHPKSTLSNPRSQGSVWAFSDDVPHDTLNNIWYPADLTYNFSELRAGEHVLKWEWSMTTCSDQGRTTTYTSGNTQASGSIYFTIVDNGSGEKKMDWTAECPVYQGRVTAKRGTTAANCPYLGEDPDDEPDPCKAKMDSVTAACVLANVTESSDRSACQELAEMAAGQGNGKKGGGKVGGSNEDGDGDEDTAPRAVLTALGVVVPAFIAFMMV